MRNKYKGVCYRCGKEVQPGHGFFEKTNQKRLTALGIGTNKKFLTQHKECSVKWHGTTQTYKSDEIDKEVTR